MNLIWVVIGESANKLSVLLAHILYAKSLQPSVYGVFSTIFSIAIFLSILMEIGSTVFGTRQVAILDKTRGQSFASNLIGLRFISGLIIATLMFAVALSNILDNSIQIPLFCFSIYILAISVRTEWIFQGLEQYRYIALGNSVAFLVVFISFFLVKSPSDLNIACFSIALSRVLTTVILILILRKNLAFKIYPDFSIEKFQVIIRKSYHFLLSGIFGMGYLLLPPIILLIATDTYQAGLFNGFYRPILSIGGLLAFLPMALYPLMSKAFRDNRTTFIYIKNILLVSTVSVSIAISLITFIFGDWLILNIFGDSYIVEVRAYYALVLLIPLYGLKTAMQTPLITTGDFNTQVRAAMLACVSTLILGVPFIYCYGLIGAAVSTVVVECIYCFVLFNAFRKI